MSSLDPRRKLSDYLHHEAMASGNSLSREYFTLLAQRASELEAAQAAKPDPLREIEEAVAEAWDGDDDMPLIDKIRNMERSKGVRSGVRKPDIGSLADEEIEAFAKAYIEQPMYVTIAILKRARAHYSTRRVDVEGIVEVASDWFNHVQLSMSAGDNAKNDFRERLTKYLNKP